MTQLARKQTVVKRARRVVVKIGSSLLSAEEGLDLALHRRDKGSDRAVVWSIAIGEGDEEDVFLTGAFI